MRIVDISSHEHLEILSNDEITLTGQNDNLSISISENINVNILISNTKIGKVRFQVGDNSSLKLEYVSLLDKKSEALFDLGENASLDMQVIATKGVDEKTIVNLNGMRSRFSGRYLILGKDSNAYITTKVNHKSPHTWSKIENLGVALSNGKVRFETIGKIEKGEVKSSCQQYTRGIIFAGDAEVIAQPILLVDEYDVQANHGVAIGKIPPDEIFYMMSRGLRREEVEQLIISSYITPFIENLLDENLQEEITRSIYSLL